MMDKKERQFLEASIVDCIKQCELRSVPKFKGFLDASGAAMAHSVALKAKAGFLLWGGYEGAERCYFGVFPEWCQPETEQFPISRLRVINKSDRALSHRDILGALMSAGIERDTVGDILPSDGGAVVFVSTSVAQHIMGFVTKIASAGVSIVRDTETEICKTETVTSLRGTVASLRLDCIVAELAKTSRSKAAELIESGLVAVNGLEVLKLTAEIKNGDTVTVRKTGRFIIDSTDKVTKKQRIALEYRKFI